MKHTIEIDGLPENIEIESAEICTPISSVYDGMSVGVILKTKPKKKQPRRIVLEETDEENYLYKSGQCAAFSAGEFIISGTRNKWRIVEDSGENND